MSTLPVTGWTMACEIGGCAWKAMSALNTTKGEVEAHDQCGRTLLEIRRDTEGVDVRVFAHTDTGEDGTCSISLDDVPASRVVEILRAAGVVA